MSQCTSSKDFAEMSPRQFREVVRNEQWTGEAMYACRGYVMANLAIVPKTYAFDFMLFCSRNPRPCPILDVTDPGSPHPKLMAPDADLRTDLPRYHVLKDGQIVDTPTNIMGYWRDDLVAFLLGCSGSFQWALQAANVSFRLTGAYYSNIPCVLAGPFAGNMVVTGRLFPSSYDAVRAIQITSRNLHQHGPPVHVGDPAAIGIKDLCQPEYKELAGEIEPQKPNEIAMFWGCGVTPELVAIQAKLPFMITHAPGHMFLTDKLSEELVVL